MASRFGYSGSAWHHVGTEFSGNTVTVRIAVDMSYLACPSCLNHDMMRQGQVERRLQKDLEKALAELNQVRCAKVNDPEAKIR